MDDSRPVSRRRLLGRYGAVVAVGALAGCVGGDGDGEASLELREANKFGSFGTGDCPE